MPLRLSHAVAAAAFAVSAIAPAALAQDQQVNLSIALDTTEIVDERTANDALRSVERQAERACSYEIRSIKRKKTDQKCVNDVVEQVVTQFDVPLLTSAYVSSDMAVRVADATSALR